MANPRGQQRDKPFRDALRMELAAAGEDHKKLRQIARALIANAVKGDTRAIQEVADRMDGKPAQAVDMTIEDVENRIQRVPLTDDEWAIKYGAERKTAH